MVQIVKGPGSFSSRLSNAFTPALTDAFSKSADRYREKKEREEESAALEESGYDVPANVKNPKIREGLLEGQKKQKQSTFDQQKDEQTSQIIGKAFGKEAEELYPHLTVQGKSKYFEYLLENKLRNQDLQQTLGNFIQENPEDINIPGQQTAQSQVLPNIQNRSVGRTPKEIASEEKGEREFKRTHETKRSEKVLEEAYDASKNFNIQQANIDLIKNALDDVSGFDQDYLAELFHYEPLRTAKGTQLKSAGKDLFIKTLQGTGARPNQWIEQQIGSALTQIGKSREANETVAEISQFQLDLNKERVRLINELEDKYEKELGYVPGKIGREANEALGPYAEQRQSELAYDLRRIYEREQGEKKLSEVKKVPNGTPLTVEMASILLKKTGDDEEKAEQLARQMGFTIPDESIYERALR